MGEHPDDLTIEEILENETKATARLLAEDEVFIFTREEKILCLRG
jgi:hypothetical protein